MRFEVPQEFPVTREAGESVRSLLEKSLASAHSGDVVEVSFVKVTAMTMSFTDEFLGKLLTSRAAGDLPDVALVLTGLTEETSNEIDVCLERRGAAIAWQDDGEVILLGGEKHLRETFAVAAKRGTFRASDLADDLKLRPQNVNNRLKKLVDDGALIRDRRDPDRGGREFIYRIPSLA
jgi:DNA-binding transcriptional ArsR family regulator